LPSSMATASALAPIMQTFQAAPVQGKTPEFLSNTIASSADCSASAACAGDQLRHWNLRVGTSESGSNMPRRKRADRIWCNARSISWIVRALSLAPDQRVVLIAAIQVAAGLDRAGDCFLGVGTIRCVARCPTRHRSPRRRALNPIASAAVPSTARDSRSRLAIDRLYALITRRHGLANRASKWGGNCHRNPAPTQGIEDMARRSGPLWTANAWHTPTPSHSADRLPGGRDKRHGQPAGQVGIFAVGFLAAAQRDRGEIDVRCPKGQAYTNRPPRRTASCAWRALRGDASAISWSRPVPHRRHPDRLRKRSGQTGAATPCRHSFQ